MLYGEQILLLARISQGEAHFKLVDEVLVVHIKNKKELLLRLSVARKDIKVVLAHGTKLDIYNFCTVIHVKNHAAFDYVLVLLLVFRIYGRLQTIRKSAKQYLSFAKCHKIGHLIIDCHLKAATVLRIN